MTVDPERESFWMVIRGEGTVTRGGKEGKLAAKDLLTFPAGEPHAFTAGTAGLEFFDVAWTAKVLAVPAIKEALASPEGVGENYGSDDERAPDVLHIAGSSMPPQEGDTCFRYAHDRKHSSLDHWDQNSTSVNWRAADHSHVSNEEFWYIVEGEGAVEHGGAPGVPGTPFPVTSGSLIGHPVGCHHTLVASDAEKPIKWCAVR